MIEQVLEAMRIPVLSAKGFEADDVMATLAVEGAARGLDVFLCTSDKDCRQLLTDKVKILNLRKGEPLDAAGLMADWGVRPEQVVDFQALVGDSVDNVPGVPGVGPKTAAKWLASSTAPWTTWSPTPTRSAGRSSRRRSRRRSPTATLELSRKLVRLDTQRADGVRLGRAGGAATGTARGCWSCSRSSASAGSPTRSARRSRRAGRSGTRRCSASIGEGGATAVTAVAEAPPKDRRPRAGQAVAVRRASRDDGTADATETDAPTVTWKADYQLVDTKKAVRQVPEEAQEAEAVHLRPGDDGPRPAAGGARRVRVLLGRGGGVLPAGPRAGGVEAARPGRRRWRP